MNNKYYKIIFIVSLFIVSCNNKEIKRNEIKSQDLNGERTFVNKYNLYNTYFINSLLLIRNMPDKNSSVFSLFEIKNDTHIADFGNIGDGPNEFENEVYYTNQFYNSNGEIKIWVY